MYVYYVHLEKSRFRSKKRPRSGRFRPRSVEVGQVEKNRPTPNTKHKG